MKDIENIFDSKLTQEYNPYLEMGKAIINSVKQYGIGMLPKSDIEGLIFHNICNVIEDDYSDNIHELDYVLMELLRISPSKLRTLRINRSAKYLNNLDYNNKENRLRMIRAFKHASVSSDDIYVAKIKISISDPHTQNLIERMIEHNKGVVDRALNPKLLIINAKEFIELISLIYGEGSEDGYQKTINAIKKESKILHNNLTKENILEEFEKAFKEKAVGKLVELGCKVVLDTILKV